MLYWLPESQSQDREKTGSPRSTNPSDTTRDQTVDADASNTVVQRGDARDGTAGGGEEIKVIVSQDDGFADSKSDSETSSTLDKLGINDSTDVKIGEDHKNLSKNDEKMETGSVGSKSSSCLTPSDERSNDENVSSLKESDNASSESGSLNE